MDPLEAKISAAIHGRDLASARRLIPKYLAQNGSAPEARLKASEFYRALADFPASLRVLPRERHLNDWLAMSPAEKKLQMQLTRLLNLLGASTFALRIIDAVSASDRPLYASQMAGIYLSNYRYADALACLECVPENERNWLHAISRADCLAREGEAEEALAIAEGILGRESQAMIQGIVGQARGEYLLRLHRADEALASLVQASRYFKRDDRTHDHGFLQKWLGICLLKLGREKEARLHLDEALTIHYRPGYKPEAWFEVLYWLGKHSDPELCARFQALAGSSPAFKRVLSFDQASAPVIEHFVFASRRLLDKPLDRHFDRVSDLFSDAERGETRLGLDLVDELVCQLLYAGPYGLPQYRLYELLWPEELFSFNQLQKRLEQLVLRARKHRLEVEWNGLHLKLLSADISCSAPPQRIVRGLAYLKTHREFRRADVQRALQISQASAILLCRGWIENGLITTKAPGLYQSCL